jgi:hypothetical protein
MIAAHEPSLVDRDRPRPSYFEELEAVYASLEGEVARLAPVCLVSGRCCRFREYGHTLFLSEAELEYLLRQAPEPVRALDDGQTCPWQDDAGRCTARQARPLGCRVYFCDPAYEEAAPALAEHFIARLKDLADHHGLPWNYAPLHRHLHDRREEGDLSASFGPFEPS